MMVEARLTVLFEAPFWIGLYERTTNNKYEVCKITFGPEPKDYQVYDFCLSNWHRLKFSSAIEGDRRKKAVINPKRLQREINKQLQDRGLGTKAQQALKLQHEQNKVEGRKQTKEEKEAEKARRFALRQEKKKAKHRGR